MSNIVERLPDGTPALRVMPMPPDTNQYGDVFGGWIMSQVDLAGASAAARRALCRTVTVAVTSFTFKEPVWVGDIVSFYAKVLKVGRTSITVDVEVYAERLHKDNHKIVKVTEAQLVYVAIGPDGKPQPVDRPVKQA
jgi:acyl-CoA thioesterase YciA